MRVICKELLENIYILLKFYYVNQTERSEENLKYIYIKLPMKFLLQQWRAASSTIAYFGIFDF